ncbi:MAG: hypothetical protein E7671_01675 [Ruminococcaceae bacterium]|nr:hypothetical protein [Oscillospiraceae bacterium]
MASTANCEVLRRGGREVMRVSITLPDFEGVSPKISDFYTALSEKVKKGALSELGERAKSEFDGAMSDDSRRRAFFRRYNYSFECRQSFKNDKFISYVTDVCIERSGVTLFSFRIGHIWDMDELSLVSPLRARRLFCEDKGRLFFADGVFLCDGNVVFYKNAKKEKRYEEISLKNKLLSEQTK